MNDAIISIKPRHVKNILAGAKTVELRTRAIKLPAGSRLWIYSTLPVGKVEIFVEIDFVEILPPKKMWRKYNRDICVSKSEYNDYTKNRQLVSARGLKNVSTLKKGIRLETMRSYERDFQPPQFFSKLYQDRAIYSAFYS